MKKINIAILIMAPLYAILLVTSAKAATPDVVAYCQAESYLTDPHFVGIDQRLLNDMEAQRYAACVATMEAVANVKD